MIFLYKWVIFRRTMLICQGVCRQTIFEREMMCMLKGLIHFYGYTTLPPPKKKHRGNLFPQEIASRPIIRPAISGKGMALMGGWGGVALDYHDKRCHVVFSSCWFQPI